MPNWLKPVFVFLSKAGVVLGAVVVWFSLFALKSAIVVKGTTKEQVKKFLGI